MRAALPAPALCLVTNIEAAGSKERMLMIVSEAVRGGVNVVQIREKGLSQDALARFAKQVIASANGAVTLVNENVFVARLVGADGVHLPEKSSFQRISADILTGRSVHSLESCREAEKSGAVDFLIMGSVFPTNSHKGAQTCGLEGLEDCAKGVNIPILGIGGVNARNVREVMRTKVAGVAVQSAIIDSDDPRGAAKALKHEVMSVWEK